jgi:phenylacetate-CoA ligase
MDLYGPLFRDAFFPLWERRLRGRPTLEHLKELERTQWCSLDELEAIQQRRLHKLLDHAGKHVPYYRDRFRGLGLEPGDIRRLEDLANLPVLTRRDASSSFEQRQSTASPFLEISKMTSGTSGEPLVFGYDRGSEYVRQAVKLRGYGWAGYRPGDKSLHFWGTLDALYPKPFVKRAKVMADRALRRECYLDCTDRSDERLARVVQTIRRRKPRVLLCYAQAAAALARYVVDSGDRAWDVLPVICGAERLFPHDRKLLEAAFGPAVFETYGSREFMLIATECDRHDGLHVSMENLIVEVLVREGDGYRQAAPGETGEVAVTDLNNYGLPFIRYLNGDLAVQGQAQRCGCGRALKRLTTIEGRTNDTLRDAAGNPVSGLFFNVLFSVLADRIRRFQVVQRADSSLDIKLVPSPTFDRSIIEHIDRNCRKFLPGVAVRVAMVDDIPVERSGKLRVVVVEQARAA